jgi:hypothetical protein
MRMIFSTLLIGITMSSSAMASDIDNDAMKIDKIRTENIGEISCATSTSDVLLPLSAIKARGMVFGYTIGRVEENDGCLKAYAIEKKSSAHVRLYMHPVTGVILQKRFDD